MKESKNNDASQGMDYLQSMPRRWVTLYIPICIFVFVLLFPQLVYALFDSKANLVGSMAAFTVSLILRLGGGEPLFGVPALIAYPDWMPFKTVAAGMGMILLPLVSRLTAGLNAPRPRP